MLSRPTGQKQCGSNQPKQGFGVGPLALQEALARQMDVLHHLIQILMCLRLSTGRDGDDYPQEGMRISPSQSDQRAVAKHVRVCES
jgi:hypothetical protein